MLRQIGAWPLIALALVAAMWIAIETMLATVRTDTERDARQKASAIAAAYNEQITRTLSEIDRTTLLAQRLWLESNGKVHLDDYYKSGAFPQTMFNISIGDIHGQVITSTFALPNPINFSDRDWFRQHRAAPGNGLLISQPEIGVRTGRTIIRFSRRIETEDREFRGVAWVTVEPPYLTSFYGGRQLERDEFISIRLTDGPVLASRIGGHESPTKTFYREYPVFSDMEGVTHEPAGKFADDAARFVAWKKSDQYPVVAIAALKEENVFAAYRASASAWRLAGAIGTVLLCLLGTLGSFYAFRMTQRKKQEQEIKNTYRLAVDAAQEGFYMLMPLYDRNHRIRDFRIEDCNERAASLVGQDRDQMTGRIYTEVIPEKYRRNMDALLRKAMACGFQEDEYRIPANMSGRPSWLYRRFMKSGNSVAMVLRDISHIKAHEQELHRLANNDALTGLPNRNWMRNYLPLAIERAKTSTSRLALLFIDLDDFKNVNDTLGHDAGDELLRIVAARLKSGVRANDHVVRLGGDEFTVIIEQLDQDDDAARVATALVDALGEAFALKGLAGQRIRASIGISIFPDHGENEDVLIKHADIAMYAAKAAGKGQHHFYQPELSDLLIQRLSKEQALRNAVQNDEFIVHFQPRVGVKSGRVCSFEALVRWRHPERGLIYPGEFIDIAEDSGLIMRLGELVIEKVCAQLAEWRRGGITLAPVSVNVSAHQLKHGGVNSFIAACLQRYDIAPQWIEVELTESAVIDNSDTVASELHSLRKLGVKLMIDDFGTGHSSLAQLQQLDVDVLKVDKAFTDALCKGTEGRVLFQAIVSMAGALDMCVVAEGVETIEQFEVLNDLACDEVQGYLISHAVAPEDVPHFIANHSMHGRLRMEGHRRLG
jgi:diguanylate cyclase (GGDEF)-like protein